MAQSSSGKNVPKDSFPAHLSYHADLAAMQDSAVFGLDVLAKLVAGIDAYLREDEERWRAPYQSLGPAIIGSSMWFDDPDLADRLAHFSAVCVLVSKQQRTKWDSEKFKRHRQLNQVLTGIPVDAFGALAGRVPRNRDGSVSVIGPYTPPHDGSIGAIRAVGFRKVGDGPVPLLHAKLAVIGHLWWHDEDDFGFADVVGFTPRRVWIGSANFTASSRNSLEFGMWTEEPILLKTVTNFLVTLMGESEVLEAPDDKFHPELVEPEYDDEAFQEAMRDSRSEEYE